MTNNSILIIIRVCLTNLASCCLFHSSRDLSSFGEKAMLFVALWLFVWSNFDLCFSPKNNQVFLRRIFMVMAGAILVGPGYESCGLRFQELFLLTGALCIAFAFYEYIASSSNKKSLRSDEP